MQDRHKKLLAVLLVFTLLMSVFTVPAGAASVSAAAAGDNNVPMIWINTITPVSIDADGGREFMFTGNGDVVRISNDEPVSEDSDGVVISLYDANHEPLVEVYDPHQAYLEYETEYDAVYYVRTRFNDGFASGTYNLYLSNRWRSYDTISLNESKTVTTAIGDEICCIRYTPEQDETVRFYSSNYYEDYNDTYGYLYTLDDEGFMEEIDRNDDGGVNSNFSLTVNLEAGTTYFFGAGFYGSGYGDINVTLEALPTPDDVPEVFADEDTDIYIGEGDSRYVLFRPTEDFYGSVGIYNFDETQGVLFTLAAYNSYFNEISTYSTSYSGSDYYRYDYQIDRMLFSAGETYYFYIGGDLSALEDGEKIRFTFKFYETDKLKNPEDAEPITLNEDKVIVNDQEGSGERLFSLTTNGYFDVYMYVKDFSESIQNPYVDITVYGSNLYTLSSYWQVSETGSNSFYADGYNTYYIKVRLIENDVQEGSYTFRLSDRYVNPQAAYMKRVAEEIHLGDTKTVRIATNDEVAYYKFTPEEDAEIVFTSECDPNTYPSDTYGYMYDSEGSQITYDDDSGDGGNFRIECSVYAGETYYFRANYYGNNYTGEFDVHLYEKPRPHTTDDGFTYLPSYDGTAALQSYSGSALEVVIPDVIDGYRITAIDERALSGNESVKSIIVGNNVESIGSYAFADCPQLDSIWLPASWSYYNNTILRGCPKLAHITVDPENPVYDSRDNCNAIIGTENNVLLIGCGGTTIPDSIEMIGAYAFYGCTALTDLVIPNNINRIDYGAFTQCSNITSITFSENMHDIAAMAFSYCTSLESVDIPENISNINSRAFENCSALAQVTLNNQSFIADNAFVGTPWYENQPDGIVYSGTTAVFYKGLIPENAVITFREGTTAIGDRLISTSGVRSENVVKVIIPDTVTSIGYAAFSYCPNLTEVEMSANIEYAGRYCFEETQWMLDQPDGVMYFGKVAYRFIDHDVHRSSYDSVAPTEEKTVVIKDGTVAVAAQFAVLNNNVVEVVLPDSIKTIGDYAFNGCNNLHTINTPADLEEVGAYAFASCYSLPNPVINSKMNMIMPYTFTSCTSFTDVEIPEGVTFITYNAFDNCYNLATLTLPDTLEYIGRRAFSRCDINTLSLTENVNTIDDLAFWKNYDLDSVTLNDGIERVGTYAFANTDLNNIMMPRSLEQIGTRAFGYNFYSDTEEYGYYGGYEEYYRNRYFSVIGYKGTAAEQYAADNEFSFMDLEALESCETISPGDIKEITFSRNNDRVYQINVKEDIEAAVATVVLDDPDHQFYLDYDVFDSSFSSVPMHYYWNGISYYLTAGNTYYLKVRLLGNTDEDRAVRVALNNVLDSDFKHISYDTYKTMIVGYAGNGGDITIPATLGGMTVTDLVYGTFNRCFSLSSVSMPTTLKSIGASAFRNCTALESVTLNEGLESIYPDAFVDCVSLKSVTIPASVTYIGGWAFGYTDRGLIIPDDNANHGGVVATGGQNSSTSGASSGGYSANDRYQPIEGFTVYGYYGTAGEKYAEENGFSFESLDNYTTVTDDESGIIIQTAEDNIELVVTEVSEGEAHEAAVIAVGDGNELIELYDIKLQQNGVDIQPDGRVKVRIPSDNPEAKVYRIEADGSKTDMKSVYRDGYHEFMTDHFSFYALIAPVAEVFYILGDVDSSGKVDIVDATFIQRYATEITTPYDEMIEICGDVDRNGKTDIVDATFVQRYATEISTPYAIGIAYHP